ncbi:GPI-anchored wall transfer protein [Verticillium dahliae VdLs.17]|uniref:GPI-anchored wall transfer protein n=1 Tax=Verticillium dahliae (strain VdLs.17 / ATCC MYA-4575 / FGSC 10137) TaxID=498257 RepID=G2X8C3_VERDV|nr:GPI-anchored wall transfer protein [Verticillium dahliae VdLs.17]EGY15210.1 GPI-anchored wall transfer protein [Verticillium dahliae VdLs.17]
MAGSDVSYKKLKEDFVSNLSGGPAGEVNYVIGVAPVACLLWAVLQTRQSFFKSDTPLTLLVDYLLNVGVLLLSITLYANTPFLLWALLLGPALLVYLLPRSQPRRKPLVPSQNAVKPVSRPSDAASGPLSVLSVKPFLTNYRGGMLIVTCLAILAVDFRLFPRRFAKVETWGTSLMDMGVGAFVFSAGVVAARPVLKERAAGRSTPLAARLLTSMRHSLPLLALGFIRLLSVKGLDYAEHVSEYGHPPNPPPSAPPSFLTMAVWTAVWTALYFLATSYTWGDGLDVSRRLANLPYVLWVAAFNSGQILFYCLVDSLFFPAFYHATDAKTERDAYLAATSRVIRAYNRNGLALFLLANLLTGLVNMTVPTLHVGPVATMAILIAYSGTLTAVGVALDSYDVSIKL